MHRVRMLYYQLVCLVTYINCGLRITALALELEDPASYYENGDTIPSRRVFRGWDGLTTFGTKPLESLKYVTNTRRINLLPLRYNPYTGKFNDDYWNHQWYVLDQRLVPGPVMDHNVVPAYDAGFTGKDVVVGVIGDGVKRGLPDLPNVMEWQNQDYEEDDPVDTEQGAPIGTMMAGVIAMKENNTECGVGVAYGATIVGINILSQKYTNMDDSNKFSKAIAFKKQDGTSKTLCDIYAFAIGRPDDGKFMENQRVKVEEAFNKGISRGRKGRGSIYVVGAGDGKTSGDDNCGADDFVNHPAAIAIASADHKGGFTPYSERCAAVMATAYSSGAREAMITTKTNGFCTNEYSGNNPSVGIAAGIFALALQAKPGLSARDVHHLVAMTSEVAPLVENLKTWKKNAAGFYVSNDFGFGLLNAENMVTEAKEWISVPKVLTSEETFQFTRWRLEVGNTYLGYVSHQSQIQYLELVEIICNVNLEYRGSIKISLTSPSSTEVVMLEERPRDRDPTGLLNWAIKTAHFWGEVADGTWWLAISIVPLLEDQTICGALKKIVKTLSQMFASPNKINWVKLVIHGTEDMPAHYISRDPPNSGRRTYSAFHSRELHPDREYQSG